MPKKIDARVDPRALQEVALRHFLEVAQTGSVTAAAERLALAPSAVSRSVARLEASLDTLLFERRPRGMRLNPAGEILATHARRVWHDTERAVAEIGALRGVRSGSVRLASTEGFASDFLPPLIAEFQREHAAIRFTLETCRQSDVPELLRRGDADIGFTFGTSSERDIQVVVRHAAPILAVVAPNHPLARRRHLALGQLVGYPLVLPALTSTLRQLFDISCARQGLKVDAALTTNRLDPTLDYAAAGGGVALCGELAMRLRLAAGALVAIPLRDREMNERHLEIQTLAGRALPAAVKAFLDRTQRLLGEG